MASSETASAAPIAPGIDSIILQSLGSAVAAIALYAAIARVTYSPASTPTAPPARTWVASNPSKRWVESTFIAWSGGWISMIAVIVATAAYDSFTPLSYFIVGTVAALPCVLLPALLQPRREAGLPWWQRHWVKANAWIAVLSYVGNYFWTHYFYTLLRADYTFHAWRINNVPIAMFLCTHAYFCLYHSLTNMALRRWYSSLTYVAMGHPVARAAGTCALVASMAWVTAFMETFTIQGFPYYRIENRAFMYTVGSIVYGIYFIVSFPMYLRLDEHVVLPRGEQEAAASVSQLVADAGAPPSSSSRRRKSGTASSMPVPIASAPTTSVSSADGGRDKLAQGEWTLSQTVIDSMAACMIVTILLDLWRIWYTSAKGEYKDAYGLPWFA